MKRLLIYPAIFLMLISCHSKKQASEKINYQITTKQAWATDSVFKSPESVFFDKARKALYVSNINGGPADIDGNGFMSKLNPEGKILGLHWINGLNAPKGMDVYKNKLYVADINRVVEIDLDHDSISAFYPIQGSKFLNDLTIDNEGGIYISDSQTNRIYYLKDGNSSVWLESDSLNSPNGLYFDGDILWHASSGSKEFQSINIDDKTISVIATGVGAADGVAPDGIGNFFVSNWEGEIFFIDSDGNKSEILDTRDKKINSADINYMIDTKILLVPTFNDNRIMAYSISNDD